MRILIIGYGKMGQTIEGIVKDRGHQMVRAIDKDQPEALQNIKGGEVDVAIEFTEPSSAFSNISTCLQKGIPIVSGTTGWLDQRETIEKLCHEQQGAFFYASNFSIGVNLFFNLNRYLATLMNSQGQYGVSMQEVHHTHKKDAPSGTAITLAEGILGKVTRKEGWKLSTEAPAERDISIEALREPDVPGTHLIRYESDVDSIEIKHTAHTRRGFAKGAVLAAEWLKGKQGVFDMQDMLGF